MTQSDVAMRPDARQKSRLGPALAFVYGLAVYAIFFVTFLYAVGFVNGILVPKTIDSAGNVAMLPAIGIDLMLMSVFAVQHSVMARQGFKHWWTRLVPHSIERSTYVLFASAALLLLYWQWQGISAVVWTVANPTLAAAISALSLLGWFIVLLSTFLINHFELFGLHQVFNNLCGQDAPAPRFRMPFLYKLVRHPIYLGFIIAFWAAPTMTAGHLLFAATATAYIFVGIFLEERDMIALFGDDYRGYRKRVRMLLPLRR